MRYPVFICLRDVPCLVVGAGDVARRKLSGLLEAGAGDVTVVAPSAAEAVLPLLRKPEVRFVQQNFRDEDVEGCMLVFAATDSRDVNAAVAGACRSRNILCSVADALEESRFLTPARLDRQHLHIALSTEGASPALAARIKNELDTWLEHRYDGQLALMVRLRPLILDSEALPSQAERAELFRRLASRELGEAIRTKDKDACLELLRDSLPAALRARCLEIVNELV